MRTAAVLFPGQLLKPVDVQFDTEAMTSDGGVILVGALDRGLGLTNVALSALADTRDPAPVDFPWAREWYQAALAVGAIPR